MTGVEQWPYRAVAQALEVLPRTLIQNCGASTIRTITALRVSMFNACAKLNGDWLQFCCFQAKHTDGSNKTWGVNGESGVIADMTDLGIWEPFSVKMQTYKTAMEVSSSISNRLC